MDMQGIPFPRQHKPHPLFARCRRHVYLSPAPAVIAVNQLGAGTLVEARGGTVVVTVWKTNPSLFQLSFYLKPSSFTPRLAGNEGLDVALGLG